MATSIDALRLRNILGRKEWSIPIPYGPDGWFLASEVHTATVLVSCSPHSDGTEYIHASIAHPDRTPDYAELKLLHRAAFGDGYAYLVFAPAEEHINIHDHALHLWGRLDGGPILPEFSKEALEAFGMRSI